MAYLKGVCRRFLQVLLCLALVGDAGTQVLLKSIPWIFLARARPSWRSTISATLGWCVLNQTNRVARFLSPLADIVDEMFGSGHCVSAYRNEADATFPI